VETERILTNVAITFANGLLVTFYYLSDHLAVILVLVLATVWVVLIERGFMAASAYVPPRGGRPSPPRPVSPMPMVMGGLAGLLAALAAGMYPTPVREILVAMWAAGVGVILVLPLLIVVIPIFTGIFLGNQANNDFFFGGGLAVAALCFLAYLPVLIVLRGILRAYIQAAWTLTFQQLAQPPVEGIDAAPPPEPLPA